MDNVFKGSGVRSVYMQLNFVWCTIALVSEVTLAKHQLPVISTEGRTTSAKMSWIHGLILRSCSKTPIFYFYVSIIASISWKLDVRPQIKQGWVSAGSILLTPQTVQTNKWCGRSACCWRAKPDENPIEQRLQPNNPLVNCIWFPASVHNAEYLMEHKPIHPSIDTVDRQFRKWTPNGE